MRNFKMSHVKSPGSTETKVFEKIRTTHLVLPSTMITICIFIVSLFTPYYNMGFTLIPVLPVYVSYVSSYLVLLLIIYLINAFIFKSRAINMELFASHVRVFGFHPLEFNSRLNLKVVDYVGVLFSVVFSLISLVFSNMNILFPGFLLFTILFVSSIIWGNTTTWESKRRK